MKDILGEATLEAVRCAETKLTIAAGDTYRLDAVAAYARGGDRFTRPVGRAAAWTSDAPDLVSVSGGLLRATRAGGPVHVRCSLVGKSNSAEVIVSEAPVIRRICFQVKAEPPRAGWAADNGQPFTDARGFGWLGAKDLTTRDDRSQPTTCC